MLNGKPGSPSMNRLCLPIVVSFALVASMPGCKEDDSGGGGASGKGGAATGGSGGAKGGSGGATGGSGGATGGSGGATGGSGGATGGTAGATGGSGGEAGGSAGASGGTAGASGGTGGAACGGAVDGGSATFKRVFVSSKTFTGALGGLVGADCECKKLADAAGLGGKWMAWLASETEWPATRFTKSTVPYQLVNGTKVADNWTDLTDGSLDAPINRDENGTQVTANLLVKTGPGANGVSSGANHCENWTGTTGTGMRGRCDQVDFNFTLLQFGPCADSDHLYCFEQ
jgi:hypothetical protein